MQAKDMVKEFFSGRKRPMRDTSKAMGRSNDFISNYSSSGRMPSLELASEILDAIGWDLIARDRDTGEEILIDPPEK